jgi:murein L,D-transpeptidase YafK
MYRLILIPVIMLLQQSSFKETQIKNDRVKAAYDEKDIIVKGYFHKQNLDYKGFHLFLRAFKKEKMLEAWVKDSNQKTYTLLNTYTFCSSSGTLGPKRKEGDLQIPEGIYYVNHFNPQSNFHLSLGISYPNGSDRILSDPQHPGSAIYVHGNCVTIGCIPITDEKIKELYILAVEARNNGQQKIPVHIYPCRLNEAGMRYLKQNFNSSPQLIKFWENLNPVYLDFERNKNLKAVKVNERGEYYF